MLLAYSQDHPERINQSTILQYHFVQVASSFVLFLESGCIIYHQLIDIDVAPKSETAEKLRATDMKLQTSFPLHLDNTHSVYVAVATLVSAVVVVTLLVTTFKNL